MADIFASNYYRFDYIAAICVIIGMFFLGNKKHIGFMFYMAATASRIIFATLAKSLPFMIMNVLLFIMNLRGFLLWKK
ncbi:hypothetical protein HYX11_00755 [Candidatus Woesearchaeota archaeon]|nr:hypothetical protein [Candidatus Woesearchaeota archaeon]